MKKRLYGVLFVLTFVLTTAIGYSENADSISFQKDIHPIIEQRCLRCHQSRLFAKGKYRMVSLKSTIKGGKSGSAVIPNDPDNSLLVKRITMKPDNPSRMPLPDSDDPLSNDEIKTIIDWIRQGAN